MDRISAVPRTCWDLWTSVSVLHYVPQHHTVGHKNLAYFKIQLICFMYWYCIYSYIEYHCVWHVGDCSALLWKLQYFYFLYQYLLKFHKYTSCYSALQQYACFLVDMLQDSCTCEQCRKIQISTQNKIFVVVIWWNNTTISPACNIYIPFLLISSFVCYRLHVSFWHITQHTFLVQFVCLVGLCQNECGL